MCWVVELELIVGHDLASATFLVGERAILKGDDWCACASLPLTLQWQSVRRSNGGFLACEVMLRTLSKMFKSRFSELEMFFGEISKVPEKEV